MSDKEPTVNETDQAVMLSRKSDIGHDQLEQLWDDNNISLEENRPAEYTGSLVSLAFIRAAIRRSVRFWGVLAVAGLLASIVFYAAFPPAYQASTSIFLTHPPGFDPSAITDDQVMAQSRTVARMAMQKLGLRESISSFDAAYTATALSSRVLSITVSAPSAGQAVRRANAVAAAFLEFRAGELETERNEALSSLDQLVNQAQQHVSSIRTEISQLAKQPASPARRDELATLRRSLARATTSLATFETTADGTRASTATTEAVKGSKVLDPAAPVPQSRLKLLLLYSAIGLFLGLVLGLAIAVLRDLLSDRLRLRDDVARALGTPVKLSVGRVRQGRRLAGQHHLAAADDPDIQRIVAHLRSAMPTASGGPATLAIVPVDEPEIAALATMSLAVSCAQHGKRVVVADLAGATPAACLVEAGQPGVRAVRVHDTQLTVAVPDAGEDVLPAGPFGHVSAQPQRSSFTKAVAAATVSADLLLTLVTLDPSLGSDHLATWATDAVALVTAGRASATRVHAVGEMIRLAGTHLASAVLVGADKTDESLGAISTPTAGPEVAAAEGGSAF